MNVTGKKPIPGSFELKAIELSSDFYPNLELELSSLAVEINLYENMFDDVVSGNMVVTDARNILAKLPVVGYEIVTIKYNSIWEYTGEMGTEARTESVTNKYRVHSITDYSKQVPTSAIYIINFISEEYFANLTTKISKAYRNTSISNIANLVYGELNTNKKFNIDKTILPQDLIIPNWSPFKSLNWLATRSKSGTYRGANYYFFENNDGYNFVSLESLFDKGNSPEFLVDTYVQSPRETVLEPDQRGISFKDVMDISFDSGIDISDNIVNGMYASKVIEHDIVKRSYKTNVFDYNISYPLYKHMNNGLTSLDDSRAALNSYSKQENSKITYVPKHYKKYDNIFDYGDNVEDVVQIRDSQMQQLSNFTVTLSVSGDNTRTIGDIIELKIVSPEPAVDSPRIAWDPIYSGKYLVSGIKHTIDPEKYITHMTVVKDSYKDPITKSTLRLENW